MTCVVRHTRTWMLVFATSFLMVAAHAQQFHFGLSGAISLAQVDGDNLKGFNHFGYAVGALGGYSLNESQWIVVELQRVTHGSTKKQETSTPRVELDITGYNALLGFAYWFGDSWDGEEKFRVLAGPRFNTISKVSSTVLDENQLKKSYLSGTIGLSYALSENALIDLSYTHAFSNLLQDMQGQFEKINRLVPYYLTFGVNYYLRK